MSGQSRSTRSGRPPVRPVVTTLVAVGAGLALAAGTVLPAVADTAFVGPTILQTASDQEPDTTGGPPVGTTVAAQGVVVTAMEPRAASQQAAPGRCPAAGCDYQLVLVNPRAVRAGTGPEPVTCATLDYGVIDPDPDRTDIGQAARAYQGQGRLPTHTVAAAGGPTPITPGVGLVCFASSAHQAGPRNPAGTGPAAATQPVPLAVLYDPGANGADSR